MKTVVKNDLPSAVVTVDNTDVKNKFYLLQEKTNNEFWFLRYEKDEGWIFRNWEKLSSGVNGHWTDPTALLKSCFTYGTILEFDSLKEMCKFLYFGK